MPDNRSVRMQDITDEIERLSRHDRLTGAQEVRYHELRAEFNELDREQQREELRAGVASGRLRVESGAASGQYHDPILDGSGFGAAAGNTGSSIRSAALRAIDARRDAPDHARQRMTSLLDRAQGVELDLASRWTTTTIRPEYERAVAKLFRDPQNGHREFTAEELAAFRDAKQLQRAMALSPDSAGGFLIPGDSHY